MISKRKYPANALLLLVVFFSATPALSQTKPDDGPATVPLYSPMKYKLTSGPPSPDGPPRPDFTPASTDFGARVDLNSHWILAYGNFGPGNDPDWFSVSAEGADRNVIKDLGRFDWDDGFKVPVVALQPELKPGQKNSSLNDMTARNGAIGMNGQRMKQPSSGPIVNFPAIKVVLDHMYVVHVGNAGSDFYVLVHVDALVVGDNCTISWKQLSDTSSPPSPEPGKTKFNPTVQAEAVASSRSTIVDIAPACKSASPALNPPTLKSDQPTSPAELSTHERPRLRPFGSSLDQLKWDGEGKTAVEITRTNDKSDSESSEDVVRIETRLVVSNVLVLDPKGRAVQGLTQNDFVVREDGEPQQISHFSLGDDVSVGRSIVLILDYSLSLAPYMDLTVTAAKKLVDELGPKDRMAIVTDDVELLVDFTCDKVQLSRALDSLRTKAASDRFGKSAQFSALLATLRELFDEEDTRPIVIFQTDGDQLGFMQPFDPRWAHNAAAREKIVQFSIDDVNAAVEKSPRTTIYTVIPGLKLIGLPLSEQVRRADIVLRTDVLNQHRIALKRNPTLPPARPVSLLPEDLLHNAAAALARQQAAAGVAEISGGETFFLEQPEQANEIYTQILSDVNRRYVIGYYPSNKSGAVKRRKVTIEVRNHPEYTIEGRKTYIASGPR